MFTVGFRPMTSQNNQESRYINSALKNTPHQSHTTALQFGASRKEWERIYKLKSFLWDHTDKVEKELLKGTKYYEPGNSNVLALKTIPDWSFDRTEKRTDYTNDYFIRYFATLEHKAVVKSFQDGRREMVSHTTETSIKPNRSIKHTVKTNRNGEVTMDMMEYSSASATKKDKKQLCIIM
jgi:hypothetical protein